MRRLLLIGGVPKLANICTGLIEERLVDLKEPEALGSEAVVHQLRVLTKRLRAAWHLAQPACGKEFAKGRRAALRDLSALLAQSRDRSAQLALVKKLQVDHPHISKQSLRSLCAPGAETSPGSDQAPRLAITRVLEEEISAWRDVTLGDDEPSTLRRRCRKSLKQARALTRQTARSNCPDLWHSWRKAVKRLRYQREFLGMVKQRPPGKKDLRIRQLGRFLGEHNDFANFTRHLESSKKSGDEVKAIKEAVAREHDEIKRKCRHLGRKLFRR